MSVVVIGLFWTVFVYDMMADVYGSFMGGLVVLAPTVDGLVVYAVLSIPSAAAPMTCPMPSQSAVGVAEVELHSRSNPDPVLKDQLDLNSVM